MTDLAPAKSRAWSYAVRRGFLTGPQVKEALDNASSNGPSLRDIREAVIKLAAKADKAGDREQHHALLLALSNLDDARGGL